MSEMINPNPVSGGKSTNDDGRAGVVQLPLAVAVQTRRTLFNSRFDARRIHDVARHSAVVSRPADFRGAGW